MGEVGEDDCELEESEEPSESNILDLVEETVLEVPFTLGKDGLSVPREKAPTFLSPGVLSKGFIASFDNLALRSSISGLEYGLALVYSPLVDDGSS
jgi:hypothetical protein